MRGLFVGAGLMVQGCGTDCNVLSTSHSPECNILFGTMMVVAAPAALVGGVYDTIADAGSESDRKEELEALEQRLEQGDPAAARECVRRCLQRFPHNAKGRDLHAASVRLMIATDTGNEPATEDSEVLIEAYAWMIAPQRTDVPVAQKWQYAQRVLELHADWKGSLYTRQTLARDVALARLGALDDAKKAGQLLNTCPRWVPRIAHDYPTDILRRCREVHTEWYHHDKGVPEKTLKRWKADLNIVDKTR